MPAGHMQIGEVAERVVLSLRTIRYYEEVGLVIPSARTQGGFRLYTEADVERLLLIRKMKPLDFSLEDMRGLLELLDTIDAQPEGTDRRDLLNRLAMYHLAARTRVEALRDQLSTAEAFAAQLSDKLLRQIDPQDADGAVDPRSRPEAAPREE